MSEPSGQISELLQQWIQGDQEALGAVSPIIYDELRRLAHYHLKSERADHTLQSTALVNEAFIQLMGNQPSQVENRAHFVAIASRLMRQILVQYARRRRAAKRDGGYRPRIGQNGIASFEVRKHPEEERIQHLTALTLW